MSKSHSKCLIEKSVSAAVSAIEVYNKPDFKYREETFAVLMMNAWELVLKARIVQQNANKVSSIYVYEYKQNKRGQKSKKPTVKYNRSKNAMTIGTLKAIDILIDSGNKEIDGACKENILVLQEIRDNAVHFKNNDHLLSNKVQEVGTATLRNYLRLIRVWFNYDLSKYNFFLMPLSFFHEFDVAKSLSVEKQSDQINNLLSYIKQQETKHPSNENSDFNISLKVETQFVKANTADAINFQYSNDPNALPVNITEEDAFKKYSLDYKGLTSALRKRYSNFKMDKSYHELRKQFEENDKFARTRLLNPKNPKSSKQVFYCPEIVKEFDKYYTK
jgi:Protein of unknown function (DUF3644)